MKWQGKGVSEGLAMAQIHLFTPKLPEISRQPAADAEAEVAKLEKTLAAAEEELRGLYETAKEKMGEQEAEIFDAHLTILGDEYSVREPIIQRIREQKQNAAAAITDQFDELAQMFRSLGDELMAERAADAEDLKQQLLRICLGCGRQDLSVLPGDVIVLAEELTPSDTVRMDTAHVKGIATRLGGATAHSAIIARTLGIPAAAGIDGWQTEALNGHMAILDGADGTLTVDPTDEETACYQSRKAQADCEAQALEAFRTCPSQTKDGAALEICANIGTPQEAQQAMKYGADGVGLFRSEFLFMDRDALPTEDEQFEAYRTAAQTMAGKPLIIRTQLREAKALLREQEQTLQAEGVPTGPVKVGMMVEIPAAAVLAEEFAKEVDFFSIGTNDLTQYTLAVERGNAAVAHLYAPEHPAVLRLIAMTAQAAAERHIPCGMCGEAAGDPKLAPAFVGMGVNELSMSPRRVPAVRKLLSGLTMDECRQAAEKLLHP